MNWTQDLPTKAGLYWYRLSCWSGRPSSNLYHCRVWERDGTLVVNSPSCCGPRPVGEVDDERYWYGPFRQP